MRDGAQTPQTKSGHQPQDTAQRRYRTGSTKGKANRRKTHAKWGHTSSAADSAAASSSDCNSATATAA
jgi:hypothetical protein